MIKLLIGGSPCTHWSIARPTGRETVSEGIGWELFKNYLVARDEFASDYFLYENVASMSEQVKDQITEHLGIEPIRINGALVSAAERDRFYWTNFPCNVLPEDRGLVLKDILQSESEVDEKYYYSHPLEEVDLSKQVCATMIHNNNEMHKRVFNPEFKVHTLTACAGGNHQKKVLINGRVRKLTPIEYERCMTLPDNYTKGVSDGNRYSSLGNGWTAEVIIHLLNGVLKDIPRDEKIVVLSMYDGIGTGRYCLDKMGFTNVEYHAYEIDKYAIKVAMSNYPDIIQHGDAFAVREERWRLCPTISN